MPNFSRGIIRASSFFRKEIFEILRQPRLVATLVLGPFLILFIFGIGYRAQSPTLRTLFVAQPGSPIAAQDIQQYAHYRRSGQHRYPRIDEMGAASEHPGAGGGRVYALF